MSACSNLFFKHASCIPSLSCLPFLYHPFFNSLNTCLHSFLYMLLRIISVKGGKPPIKIIILEKMSCLQTCGHHGNILRMYTTFSSPCVLPLVSLRSEEEVILKKSA